MKTRGVICDAGTVYGTGLISISTRLALDRTTTRRELEIIATNLHGNAVPIVTDPALATWPWFSGKQTTPVRCSREVRVSWPRETAPTEGHFDASG